MKKRTRGDRHRRARQRDHERAVAQSRSEQRLAGTHRDFVEQRRRAEFTQCVGHEIVAPHRHGAGTDDEVGARRDGATHGIGVGDGRVVDDIVRQHLRTRCGERGSEIRAVRCMDLGTGKRLARIGDEFLAGTDDGDARTAHDEHFARADRGQQHDLRSVDALT
jgi:hypothetical protein